MKKIKLFPLLLMICLVFSMWAPSALALDEPTLNARRAVVVDLNSDRILYSKDMDAVAPPASLTKIMTVLLAVESIERGEHSLDETITAANDCLTGLDELSSTSGIVPGEQMSFENFLYCAMVQSANEACNAIASYVAGDISSFVALMNRRAMELGCTSTNFVDPNGLSGDNQTTAYDMYLIANEAIKHPGFVTLFNTASYTVPATNMSEAREMHNSNALICSQSIYGSNYVYEYAGGGKTGFLTAAGYCLVSTAEKDGVRLLAVVMGCDGAGNAGLDEYKNFSDSITAYDWVFDNFAYRTVLTASEPIEKVGIELAKDGAMATLRPQSDVTLLLPKDLDSGSISTTVTVYEDKLVAPIDAGTVLGEARLYIDGQDYGVIKLVNSVNVELARGEYFKLKLKEVFSKGWVIAVILIVAILAIVYIILVANYRKMRRKHLRERKLAEQRRRAERERMYNNDDEYWS